jgi:hypothetical protein
MPSSVREQCVGPIDSSPNLISHLPIIALSLSSHNHMNDLFLWRTLVVAVKSESAKGNIKCKSDKYGSPLIIPKVGYVVVYGKNKPYQLALQYQYIGICEWVPETD